MNRLFLIAAFAFSCLIPRADELDEPRAPKISGAAPGELIVRYKSTTTKDQKAKVAKKVSATPKAALGSEHVQLLKIDGNVDQARRALENDPSVLYVEPNYKTRVFDAVVPNDFEFESLYSLRNTGADGGKAGADVKAPEAWQFATGSRDIVVAVIDTGMDYFHEDLRANVWTNTREIPGNGIDDDGNGYVDDVHGYDFVSNDSDPMDDHFHGTHVSGTIGAVGNNGLGTVGICWNVRLMPIKAFDDQGNGTVSSAIAAIHYAVVNGARVINASWGLEDRSRALSDSVAEAQAAGIVFVAAAGNSRTETPFYPAGYDSVIAVASTNNRDERSNFSNFGAYVDISAPGEQILSTIPDGRYDSVSGTSMAAPHVSGAAALILARHPDFTPPQIATILKNTADPVVSDKPIGRGRLNIFNAIQIDLPLPNAELKLPTSLYGRIDIRGAASGPHFQRYSLAYGTDAQPTSWAEFFSSTQQVTNNILASAFDTSTLNDGVYTFRLTVWNDNGQSSSDLVTVKILNVQISFPLSTDILRAATPLVLRGTVFGQGRHYGIEWARGLAQTNWSSDGISLPGSGEVLNDVLGTFDTSRVAPNEYYSFRLSATNSSGDVQRFYANFIWLDSRLRAGWPIYLPYDGAYSLEDFRQAKVADLDGDGHQEILIVDHGNSEGKIARLLVFTDAGALKWSRDLNGEAPYADVPTIADMNGDGKMEIFVDVGSKLYAFDSTGADLPGLWPITLSARGLGKVAADLFGDGKKELIAQANVPDDASNFSALNVYDVGGHVLQHWNLPSCEATNIAQRVFPVVANMDDGSEPEIVVVTACSSVSVYSMERPDGPVWSVPIKGSAISSPVVADLDRDGKNEIVVTTWAAKDPAGIYVFDRKGNILPGWPNLADDSFLNSAAVADLDGDGKLEIVAAGDRQFRLHVLALDGFELEGWPVSISTVATAGGISLADIDGDSFPDVIYTAPGFLNLTFSNQDPSHTGGVNVWDVHGRPVHLNGADSATTSIPMEGSAASGYLKASPVTVTDLDGNGKIDLIGASIRDRTYVPSGQTAALKNRSTLYAWELDSAPSARFPGWPEFRHGADNNGFLSRPKPPPPPPDLLQIPDQIVAVGQSFPPIALDQFLSFPGPVWTNLYWGGAAVRNLSVDIDTYNVARVSKFPSWEGTEAITYTVTDGATFSKSIVVNYSAIRGYVPPVANPDSISTKEDAPIEIDVLANDLGSGLAILNLTPPLHGHVQIQNNKVLYQPNTNFFGTDSFAYILRNDSGATAVGSVSVTVTPVNDAPIAKDDRALTFEDSSVTIDVRANDLEPDGDPLSVFILSSPQNGAVEVTADAKIQYTPAVHFNGTNNFTYVLVDPFGLSSTGRVTVIVRPLNTAPVAQSQNVIMTRNSTKEIFYQAEDIEGDHLTFRIIKPPDHGEFFSYPNLGDYTPTKGYFGTDSFSYRASDGFLESAEAFVNITILNTNNPPKPSSISLMTRINQAANITLAAVDVDDDPVTFRIVTPPAHGFIDGVSSNYVYTPNFNYLGKDSFTFAATDGFEEAIGTVQIETTDKNTAPFANVKFVKTFPNTPASFVITGVDAESNPLNFKLVTQTTHGILSGSAPYLVYTPDPNYVGPDRFKFTVSDSEFTSDPAAVTISVAPKNTLPVGIAQTVNAYVGIPTRFDLNVHDADADPLQIVVLKGPRFGKISGSGITFTYTPTPGNDMVDYFTYKPWDGQHYGNETQVRIEQNLVAPTPAVFTAIQISPDLLQLTVTNRVGQTLRLESSTDFRAWTPVTNILSSPGKLLFSIPPTNTQTYFRALVE